MTESFEVYDRIPSCLSVECDFVVAGRPGIACS